MGRNENEVSWTLAIRVDEQMGACEQNHEKETSPTGKFRARGIPKGKRYREVKKRAKKQTAHKLAVEIQHAHIL